MTDNRSVRQLLVKGWLLLYRYVSPALLAVIGVLLITGYALFTPPYIGMADNGDYFRSIYSAGLYFNLPDYDSHHFGHFVRQYGIFQYFNENGSMVISSQTLFIKAAMLLNQLLFDSAVFDIRFQGIIFTLLFAAAVYLVVESLTWKIPRKQGYIIALLAVFMFGDTGYTAYFNSFYGESIVFIMMLFVFASWLLIYRKRYNDYALLAVFVISSLLLTTSKQQNAPVGLIVAVMALSLLWIRRDRIFRVLTVGSLAVLFLSGVATYALISKEFVNINQYHAMTRGVLMQSPNPEETLKTFGINEQFAILKGNIYYERYTTVDVDSPLLEKHFYSQYGFVPILKYYVTHPDKLSSMLNVAAKDAFTIRPPAMGNYEASAGKAFGEHTGFFSAYSLIKKALSPKTYGFIIIWIALVVGLYMPSFIEAVKLRNFRLAQRMILILTMILCGLSGILVSIIGAGDADLAKHEFLFTVAFDIVTFLTLSDIISRRLMRHHDTGEQDDNGPEVKEGVRPLVETKSV
ncbi:hypothetical protein [Paenibacillus sp. FJAT-26967]|uniref:glycan biosynthesis hexose transferase WsfD n=1 Tax=Paenibacillus sp. FJAT-26967 TaxID=1729690 RepID=UPI000ACA4809|nr:hypothetical protein [Paenibacillus sp. FJAT-26967]